MPYINDMLGGNSEINRGDISIKPKSSGLSRFLFDPDEVSRQLKTKIIGQQAIQEALADLLHIVKADFSSSERPLSVFLFLGPTGTGKTETVKVIAESILGNADAICRIDMNTLAQEHYMAALTGAPPGYVGSKENYTLFDSDKIKGSYSKPGIVLFDEIEKASKEVVRSLLNILDTGLLQLSGSQKIIDFRNSMIFMTSNVGAQVLASYHAQFSRGIKKWLSFNASYRKESFLLDAALQQSFDPEFINRIDNIIMFRSIKHESLSNIFDLQIATINQKLSQKNVAVAVDQQAKSFILKSYDTRYGARDIGRHIYQLLSPKLARLLNNKNVINKVLVSLNDGKIIVSDNTI